MLSFQRDMKHGPLIRLFQNIYPANGTSYNLITKGIFSPQTVDSTFVNLFAIQIYNSRHEFKKLKSFVQNCLENCHWRKKVNIFFGFESQSEGVEFQRSLFESGSRDRIFLLKFFALFFRLSR
jgi:hypothetical protein